MMNLREELQGIQGYHRIVQAMVDGVRAALKRPDFKMHMSYFGHHELRPPKGRICYGCADHIQLHWKEL